MMNHLKQEFGLTQSAVTELADRVSQIIVQSRSMIPWSTNKAMGNRWMKAEQHHHPLFELKQMAARTKRFKKNARDTDIRDQILAAPAHDGHGPIEYNKTAHEDKKLYDLWHRSLSPFTLPGKKSLATYDAVWRFMNKLSTGPRALGGGGDGRERNAKLAERGKSGNCQELSAIAFTRLTAQSAPLIGGDVDIPVALCACLAPGDHQFVIIGAPMTIGQEVKARAFSGLIRQRVICDPWWIEGIGFYVTKVDGLEVICGRPPSAASMVEYVSGYGVYVEDVGTIRVTSTATDSRKRKR